MSEGLETSVPDLVRGAVDRLYAEILPDSRLQRASKGATWRGGAWWVPVYCANCGKPYGLVPEENCVFACWLCNDCQPKWGQVAGLMLMPDEVFWEKVNQEQLDKHGRLLSETELVAEVEKSTSLGKLIQQGA